MKTKKILFILLALFLICPRTYSQNSVDDLFKTFSKEKGVIHVGVGKFVMKFAGLFTDVMGVTEVKVLSFEECEQPVRDKLSKAIASLKDKKYETMISVNEEKERTKVLVKIEDEYIRELIVLTSGDEPAMVRIKGKIKPSDIGEVIDKNKSDKK